MSVEPETFDRLDGGLYAFHQSLRAAVVAGARLDLSTQASDTDAIPNAPTTEVTFDGIVTLAMLDRIEPRLVEWAKSQQKAIPNTEKRRDRVRNNDDAVSGVPAGYLRAYRKFVESERMDLVLDSLSLRRCVSLDLAGTVRSVWFYLAAMSLVAMVGVAVFSEFSLPRFVAIRADLSLMPTARQDENWLTLPRVGWLLVALPILSLSLLALGLSTTASATIASWFGGRRYRIAREEAVRARIAQAIERHRDDVAGSLDQGESAIVDGRARARRIGLSLVAENAASVAYHRLMRMRITLPVLLIAVLGGGGALLYGLLLFGPLILLIHDLATISTETGMWP